MWITRTSINNPVFATMVMVAITVLGVFSYLRLKVEQMPDVRRMIGWLDDELQALMPATQPSAPAPAPERETAGAQ